MQLNCIDIAFATEYYYGSIRLTTNVTANLIGDKCLQTGLQEKNSEGSKSSTHYLGDKNRFDVSSKGPSSGISVITRKNSTIPRPHHSAGVFVI